MTALKKGAMIGGVIIFFLMLAMIGAVIAFSFTKKKIEVKTKSTLYVPSTNESINIY
jgi:hypothetical protein